MKKPPPWTERGLTKTSKCGLARRASRPSELPFDLTAHLVEQAVQTLTLDD